MNVEFIEHALNPNQSLELVRLLFDCWAYCLSYSWRRSGLRRENKTGKMPTNKQNLHRLQWPAWP